jgi:hypothetical protein
MWLHSRDLMRGRAAYRRVRYSVAESSSRAHAARRAKYELRPIRSDNARSRVRFEEGLFRTAYRLRDSSRVEEEDRRLLIELLRWFGENLATPDRFNRSKSKGFYRRTTRGIAWFKDGAVDCLSVCVK